MAIQTGTILTVQSVSETITVAIPQGVKNGCSCVCVSESLTVSDTGTWCNYTAFAGIELASDQYALF